MRNIQRFRHKFIITSRIATSECSWSVIACSIELETIASANRGGIGTSTWIGVFFCGWTTSFCYRFLLGLIVVCVQVGCQPHMMIATAAGWIWCAPFEQSKTLQILHIHCQQSYFFPDALIFTFDTVASKWGESSLLTIFCSWKRNVL